MRTLTFNDALEETQDICRHLLLGNGFSIAADNRFRYSSLFETAFGPAPSRLKRVFEGLNTTDFETVLRTLNETIDVVAHYAPPADLISSLEADRDELRRRLVQVITLIHPANSRSLSDEQYSSNGRFLRNFRSRARAERSGQLYTTSYDLLLYWSTLANSAELCTRDGFSGDPLTWREANLPQQTVFHLHGALHLYESASLSLSKLVYGRDANLVDQISDRLLLDDLPLFVSEGTSAQKLQRIDQSPYLSAALESFEAACSSDDSCLFVFGHSLRGEDEHILSKIANGRIQRVYVSAFDVNQSRGEMAAREALWRETRAELAAPDVELILFSAQEAAPWG